MFRVVILSALTIANFGQIASAGNQKKYTSMDQIVAEIDIPSASNSTGVYSNGSFVVGGTDPFQRPQIGFKCSDPTLLPVTASQIVKDYHANYYARYNHFTLKKPNQACGLWSKQPNSEGVFRCLTPDVFEMVLMSSIYGDKCGNYYRAYWVASFFKKDDNMGTLLAKGNTVYQRNGSDIKGDFIDAQTYSVDAKEFLFFTAPTAKDMKNALDDRERVLKYTHEFNSDGTFSLRE